MMTLRGLGNLAKILEEAAKPDSVLREDREKPKPKVLKKGERVGNTRIMDPKRKVWYEKRLKEITSKAAASESSASGPVSAPTVSVSAGPALAKNVASKMGGSLLQTLAAAKDAKPKVEGTKRSESWRRKPGESIF
jgi:hypothetical protein